MQTAQGKVRAIKGSDGFFGFAHNTPPTHRSTSTSLVKLTQLVTYQSSENNRVGDGTQEGVVDLSAKSRREREIDSEPADGDKSKTKPVCVCVCGFSYFYLHFQRAGFCWNMLFFFLIEDVQDETLKECYHESSTFTRWRLLLRQPEPLFFFFIASARGSCWEINFAFIVASLLFRLLLQKSSSS